MFKESDYSFQRYLIAKKTLDDRSINHYVFDAFRHQIEELQQSTATLRMAELGGGIGTMIERLVRWELPLHGAEYTLFDNDPANIAFAGQHLATHLAVLTSGEAGQLQVRSAAGEFKVKLVHQDVQQLIQENTDPYDVIIAHAFLDLLDLPTALPGIMSLLRPGGLFYFTINFDGITAFEPAIDLQYDRFLESLYHQTMDKRMTNGQPSGDSRTGRHLLAMLHDQILAAGSSDWVVCKDRNGTYQADEAYFLHFIVHTFEGALINHPENHDKERFRKWIARRHEQIERGELIYIAHQLDLCGTIN